MHILGDMCRGVRGCFGGVRECQGCIEASRDSHYSGARKSIEGLGGIEGV